MLSKLKLIAVTASLMLGLLSLLALLQVHRFKQLLIEVESSLVSVPALALKRDIERTLAFGLPLRDNRQLETMLQTMNRRYSLMVSVHLIDADLEPGKILWQDGPPLASPKRVVAAHSASPRSTWFDARDPSGYLISWPITDPIGRLVANLTIRFDKSKPMRLVDDASAYLLQAWALLSGAALLVMLPVLLFLLAALDRMVARAGAIIGGQRPSEVDDSDLGRLATQIAAITTAPPEPHG